MDKFIIKLTDDQELINLINQKLAQRHGICPCALLGSDATEEEKRKYKCMCEPFRMQQHEGSCHCGKYIKVLKN